MRQLPLAPAGCTLSAGALAAQRARAEATHASVRRIEQTPAGFRVRFGPSVDPALVSELVATERECCSFLDIDYDERRRVLSVGSADREAAAPLAALFGGIDD